MFLDTSGFYCFFNQKDWRHADAVDFMESAETRLTSSYVLAEFIPLCYSRKLNQRKTLDFVADLLVNPLIEIIWVDENMHKQAFALLQERQDKTYSLCDAVSFLIMRKRNLLDALTTDEHFDQESLVRLLKR